MEKNYFIIPSAFENNMNLEDRQKLIGQSTEASIGDAYWFLSRQWQMGEFRGSNGGSPLMIKSESCDYYLAADKKLPMQVIIESASNEFNDINIFDEKGNLKNENAILDNSIPGNSLEKSNCWDSERLEYKVEIVAKRNENNNDTATLYGIEYQGQGLDWYTFDIGKFNKLPQDNMTYHSVIPTQVTFPGMPKSRFWEFENNRIDFGGIDAQNNFLGLLLMEFGLLYSNDWFIIPVQQENNSIRFINKIKIEDVFNVDTIALDHESTNPSGFQQFALQNKDSAQLSTSAFLLFPDSVIKSQIGEPLEKVIWFRDENANMIWAVEYTVNGQPVPKQGNEHQTGSQNVKTEERHFKYVPLNVPAKNYIPFLPKQISANTGEMKLRRGRTNLDPFDIQYKTKIVGDSVFVYEEEIPGMPLAVSQHPQLVALAFENTNTFNPLTYYLWIGRKNNTSGKVPESNFRFDSLI